MSLSEELERETHSWRQRFIKEYRANHLRILNAQLSMVGTLLMILRDCLEENGRKSPT